MNRNSFSKEEFKLRIIGIYQIAGGIIGVALTLVLFLKYAVDHFLLFLIFLLAISLFSYSIYCGVLLINRRKKGLDLSLISQYLQLISFSINGFSFQYISGITFSAGFSTTNSFSLLFNLGISSWKFNINSGSEIIMISFNFVSLLLILVIKKLKKQIKENEIIQKIDSIGMID